MNECTNFAVDPNRDTRDDANSRESDNISVSESINSKSESNHREWESLNLIKSKTFSIKDILGLDENDKSLTVKNDHRDVMNKQTKPMNSPCNYFFFFSIFRFLEEKKKTCKFK